VIYDALRVEYAVSDPETRELFWADGSTEENIALTALAMLTASRAAREDAHGMADYLMNHTASSDLHVLELAAYVMHFLPTHADDSSFSYRLSGEEHSVTLSAGQRHTLRLNRAEWESLEWLSADEGIVLYAVYGTNPEEALGGEEESRSLTLRKSITPDGQPGIYRVTIDYEGVTDRDHLQFCLFDCIPAGARFFRSDRSYSSNRNSSAWLNHRGGQNLAGYISVNAPKIDPLAGRSEYAFAGQVSYLIRCAAEGEFISEGALAISLASGNYAMTERMTVTIADHELTIVQ